MSSPCAIARRGRPAPGGVDLGGDGRDLVDDAEVRLEVACGEARVGLAPVVVGELLGERIAPVRKPCPSGE
jgi:hypothetical protein